MTPLTAFLPVVYHRIPRKSMEVFCCRMKKKISVRELRSYYEKHKPSCICYQTENQDRYRASDPCKLKMSFPVMLIFENPNLICLKSSGNTMSFDRVKSVEIDTDSSVLGDVFTLFCGDFNTDDYDITYTLVVS